MNDASFIPTSPRYLLQIASNGEWKTVAYLNDLEEARRTMEKVADLRVFDTWNNGPIARPSIGSSDQDLVGRRVKRISRKVL
jgi:hypothetical protein